MESMATIKQKEAIKNVVGNGGNVTKAMLDAGYSPNTANTPGKLTNSKPWKELVEVHLKDDLLLQKHEEALEATKWNDFTGEREEDHTTRLKAVELGYKLKKRLGPEVMQQFNVGGEMTLEFVGPDENTIK
jgi:phage terminase small subunit